MITQLTVLNSSGDTKIQWDHSDPEQCHQARQMVASLKDQGYSFFQVSGDPADEISAGNGILLVRKLSADEVVWTEPIEAKQEVSGELQPESVEPIVEPGKKKRGRPAKGTTAQQPTQSIVAVRPVRGG